MLSVSHLSKSFGSNVLLDDITFSVTPGEKVALVGRNGCGKTTLMRILCGTESYDNGQISFPNTSQVGYLGQEQQLDPQRSLYDEMLTAFDRIKKMEQSLRELEDNMSQESTEVELEILMKKYSNLQNAYLHSEPHLIESKIATVLHGMGFKTSDFPRLCSHFSGGWQMRAAMAKMLLREPDMLLLDEPTNHLDIFAVEWLEDYLKHSFASVLLVSHDRYFLDRVVSRTMEIHNTVLSDYAGNYSFFLQEREMRRKLQQAAYDNQQKKIEQENKFIDRFRFKATLATRVQSRIKLQAKRELVDAPDRDMRSLKAKFETALPSGREVLTVKNLYKSYGNIKVLEGFNMEVERAERVALVGANGVGKSTLLRMLADLESPDSGSIRAGFKLSAVYYAQHQAEALNQAHTVLEEVEEVAPRGTDQTRIRTILGSLLFEGDDVYKPISVLSGGERSRVALARCILTPSNLLLLDEPTNHLDITSREALLDALSDYEGTILLVTHDRHFINSLATCVIEIKNGTSTRYIGDYDNYHAKRLIEEQREKQLLEQAQKQAKANRAPKVLNTNPKSQKNKGANEGKPIKWKLEALEKRIFELEDSLSKLAEDLADPSVYSNPEKAAALKAQYEKQQEEAASLTAIWDEMT